MSNKSIGLGLTWLDSRNINEVIRAVLNFLFIFFFYKKILHAPKAQKALKAPKSTEKAPKALKGTKTLANKRISDYFPLRCFLRAFFIFVRL